MPFSGIRPCIRGLFFIKFSNRSGWIALWITMGKRIGSARPGLKRGRRPASRSLVPEDRRSRLGLDAVRVDIARRHAQLRSEEHTSELQSLMRISYAVFCLQKKKKS